MLQFRIAKKYTTEPGRNEASMKSPIPSEWQRHLEDKNQAIREQTESSVQKIEEIAKDVDAVKLFVTIVAAMSIGPAEQISEARYGSVPARVELLAYYLYPFFRKRFSENLTPWHIKECREALETLFVVGTVVGYFPETEAELSNPVDRIISEIQRHTKIVRGTAYPEQTSDEIVAVQGTFESWFYSRVGIGPGRAQAVLWSIILTLEDKANRFMSEIRDYTKDLETHWRASKQRARNRALGQLSEKDNLMLATFKDKRTARTFGFLNGLGLLAPELLPVSQDDLINLDPPLTTQEWDALINLIGLTVENRASLTNPVQVRQKPLFVLPDNRVLLIDISNALDVLWEEFEQIAKSDQTFFQKRYQRRKADWLEEKVVEYLSKPFPSSHVYSDLTYPDPDDKNSDGAIAELDAAVVWGPFLILVEAKAKQFRLESQLGDIGRFRTDIKENVEDAFEQAKRAVRYIEQTDKPEFVEAGSQRKLTVDKKRIRKTYLLTVSQHHLAGFATRLASLQDLGLFKDGDYPFSISVADLGIISEFCSGPEVFLHYVERRLSLQISPENIIAEELDFFGAYLATRLQPERIWKKENKKFDTVFLSGWLDWFDAWMMNKRGELDQPPSIKLDIPDKIQEILTELGRRNDDAAKWIAFALLDMSEGCLEAITRAFEDIKSARPKPGMFRRFVYQEGDIVVSITASLTVSPNRLYDRTKMRTVVEKYRRKVAKSMGFGVMILETSRPIEYAVWEEGDWEYDEEMEELIEAEPPFLPSSDQKLPGRNEPCICGSGKKFKQCCLRKLRTNRIKIHEAETANPEDRHGRL